MTPRENGGAGALENIVRTRFKLGAAIHEILKVLSSALFGKTPLDPLLTFSAPTETRDDSHNPGNRHRMMPGHN